MYCCAHRWPPTTEVCRRQSATPPSPPSPGGHPHIKFNCALRTPWGFVLHDSVMKRTQLDTFFSWWGAGRHTSSVATVLNCSRACGVQHHAPHQRGMWSRHPLHSTSLLHSARTALDLSRESEAVRLRRQRLRRQNSLSRGMALFPECLDTGLMLLAGKQMPFWWRRTPRLGAWISPTSSTWCRRTLPLPPSTSCTGCAFRRPHLS